MNEKMLAVIIHCVIIALCLGGCRSNNVRTGDINEIAATGYVAIGQLAAIDRNLAAISERERAELQRIGATAQDIRDTVSSVFEICYRLCDTIDSQRAEIERLRAYLENPYLNPLDLDGVEGSADNSRDSAAD